MFKRTLFNVSNIEHDHDYIVKKKEYRSSSYGRMEKDWKTNMKDIDEICEDKMKVIRWLQDVGWINKEYKCPVCDGNMKLVKSSSAKKSSDVLIWRCRVIVNGNRHQVERSIRKGSWLQFSNLTLEEMLKFTYMWSLKYSRETVSMFS